MKIYTILTLLEHESLYSALMKDHPYDEINPPVRSMIKLHYPTVIFDGHMYGQRGWYTLHFKSEEELFEFKLKYL